jgi:4'-phosphopantetheinyl transferase
LNRTCSESLRDAKFVAGMCAYRVVRHELLGDLLGEHGVDAATNIDRRQFFALAHIVHPEFRSFTHEIGLLGVRLRMHRDVFTGSHRHSPGHEAGDPCDQYAAAGPMRCRDPEDQTRGRKDTVVRTQYRRPQPADVLRAMPFSMACQHYIQTETLPIRLRAIRSGSIRRTIPDTGVLGDGVPAPSRINSSVPCRARPPDVSGALIVHLWTLRVDRLDEAAVAPWLAALDATERERGARFVMARHRVQFVAAHALLRAALAGLAGQPPSAWRFVADTHGKPFAHLGPHPVALSFNLSHTEGMVGVAAVAQAGCAVGFDLEPIARRVDLAVADRFFFRQEAAWLESLAESERTAGFLRLWTLKEAFIKATGKGLTQNLASFWFDPCPPRIHFAASLGEREADWRFEQRLLDGGFVAALGLRRPAGSEIETRWQTVEPADLSADGLRCG